ncbi:MAG: redoxin domain-containing protein [Pirellulales bacterium]|nr:redoxin domain-containing protein [Pirellulales bacterium]
MPCYDPSGAEHRLSEWSERPVLVVVFVGIECPLVRLYLPCLAEIAKRYAQQGVELIALDANRQDAGTEVAAFAREFALTFPLLIDRDNCIADACGATRTPEVFVYDSNRVVRYHGRIDDQFAAGLQRPQATSHDLVDAIEAILAARDVARPSTPLSGCLIGRIRKMQMDSTGGNGRMLDDSTPTWSRDISRIFQQHCEECHRPGQIGPFPLQTFADVAGWEDMIAEVVDQRRMPPWHASPEFGRFESDLQLPVEAREAILNWIRAGAPEGNRGDLPPPRQFSEDWQIGNSDDVFAMAAKPFTVPANGVLEYQYFVVDPEFREDRWITAVECRPSNPAVVHHINVFLLPPEIGEPFERDQLTNHLLWAWAPGVRPLVLPPGMARRVAAGTKLVFQMHYTAVGKAQKDRSQLAVRYAEPANVRQPVEIALAVNNTFTLPPHAPDTRVVAWYEFQRPALLFAMHPHMHLRGRSFRFEAVYPNGEAEVLLDIPRFEFGWQYEYRLAEPKYMPEGTRICCLAHFDNSEANPLNPAPNATVRWGDQTWDEMMIGYLHIAWPEVPNSRKRAIREPTRSFRTLKHSSPPRRAIASAGQSPPALRILAESLLLIVAAIAAVRLTGRARRFSASG